MSFLKSCLGVCAHLLAMLLLSATIVASESRNNDVVLTVSKSGHSGSVSEIARFDMEMLQALPQSSFKTATIWTDGNERFVGVKLADLLRELKIETGSLRAVAINDYAVDVPVSEALENQGLIAYEMNGAQMSIRDKGPLWLVYPYDVERKYRSETYYYRSIWQLVSILVHP